MSMRMFFVDFNAFFFYSILLYLCRVQQKQLFIAFFAIILSFGWQWHFSIYICSYFHFGPLISNTFTHNQCKKRQSIEGKTNGSRSRMKIFDHSNVKMAYLTVFHKQQCFTLYTLYTIRSAISNSTFRYFELQAIECSRPGRTECRKKRRKRVFNSINICIMPEKVLFYIVAYKLLHYIIYIYV